MEERRRLGYLDALGVEVWIPRAPASKMATETHPAPPLAEAPAPSVSPRAAAGPIKETLVRLDDTRRSLPTDPDPSRMDWDALAQAVAVCRACPLHESRTQSVFGVGNRAAELMIIGEAPGADEDRLGEPFVGRAGQLLNRMLAAIGLPREQVYIANLLKCRPPGNRDPRPEEVRQCEGYLVRQIELIGPRLILCVGRIAAQHLLRTETSLGRLRGRWLELGETGIPLRVTYHPAYLLRSPDQKAKAWEDLVAVAQRLRAPARDPDQRAPLSSPVK
ncbi:MAG: uracil-DNA glycosylase [Sphingobacteriia bacterium]|nr:uracil-DNA glycosylase [Sphingobacteriia bacterium]NCC40718.1 uracil-DNA glycosylase [Gammaproteobacteria bacterium]